MVNIEVCKLQEKVYEQTQDIKLENWDHFQAINPGTSAKGRNAFSAHCAVLNQDDLGSDDDGVATTTSLITAT